MQALFKYYDINGDGSAMMASGFTAWAGVFNQDGRFYAVGGAWRAFGRLVMEMDKYPLQVLQGFQINDGQVARAAKLCTPGAAPGA